MTKDTIVTGHPGRNTLTKVLLNKTVFFSLISALVTSHSTVFFIFSLISAHHHYYHHHQHHNHYHLHHHQYQYHYHHQHHYHYCHHYHHHHHHQHRCTSGRARRLSELDVCRTPWTTIRSYIQRWHRQIEAKSPLPTAKGDVLRQSVLFECNSLSSFGQIIHSE